MYSRVVRHLALAIAIGGVTATSGMAQDTTTFNGGPMSIAYKGVTLTPVGFFTMDALWRQRNETADIGSSFNAIPFDHTTNGQLSEFRASARQSRFGLLVTGKLDKTTLGGYVESDFLSAGITSNSNESDSYTLRLRQFFGQAQFSNGFAIDAGQMWSLVTPNRSGVLPRSEYVPATIDAQFSVGYNWARQAGLRISQKIGDVVSLAAAFEEPQMTYAARNAPPDVVIGNPGGNLLNQTANYSTDFAPDVIGKIAFDPKDIGHFELKAVGSAFRDLIVDPGGTSGGTRTSTRYGGGVGAAMLLTPTPLFDIGVNAMWGRGIGRYGTSQLPDVTVKPDGTIAPIEAAQALVTLEVHATPQLDVYGYSGVEYADRTAGVNSSGIGVGYGSPLLSNAGCDAEYAPTGPYSPGAAGSASPCNADTHARSIRLIWVSGIASTVDPQGRFSGALNTRTLFATRGSEPVTSRKPRRTWASLRCDTICLRLIATAMPSS